MSIIRDLYDNSIVAYKTAKGGITMPDKEKEKRLRAVKIAKAINRIEGVPIPDETNEFFKQWIDGEISDDQLTEVMLSLCKRI